MVHRCISSLKNIAAGHEWDKQDFKFQKHINLENHVSHKALKQFLFEEMRRIEFQGEMNEIVKYQCKFLFLLLFNEAVNLPC